MPNLDDPVYLVLALRGILPTIDRERERRVRGYGLLDRGGLSEVQAEDATGLHCQLGLRSE